MSPEIDPTDRHLAVYGTLAPGRADDHQLRARTYVPAGGGSSR